MLEWATIGAVGVVRIDKPKPAARAREALDLCTEASPQFYWPVLAQSHSARALRARASGRVQLLSDSRIRLSRAYTVKSCAL